MQKTKNHSKPVYLTGNQKTGRVPKRYRDRRVKFQMLSSCDGTSKTKTERKRTLENDKPQRRRIFSKKIYKVLRMCQCDTLAL